MKKDVLLVIAILIAVGLAAFCVRFAEKEHKAVKNLEEERYSRMVAEETLQKSAAKLATLENQLKTATDKMAKVQDIVDQQKDVNADLRKQYEQSLKAKEEVETRLKAAMVEQDTVQVQPAAAPAK